MTTLSRCLVGACAIPDKTATNPPLKPDAGAGGGIEPNAIVAENARIMLPVADLTQIISVCRARVYNRSAIALTALLAVPGDNDNNGFLRLIFNKEQFA
ncbi:MAG: hypothetical protein JSW45_01910 [Thiotrichales bacterium]|nr:MAG: hypothetical protein JSW45_01910 [Thiotrichales bacterium]